MEQKQIIIKSVTAIYEVSSSAPGTPWSQALPEVSTLVRPDKTAKTPKEDISPKLNYAGLKLPKKQYGITASCPIVTFTAPYLVVFNVGVQLRTST